MAGSLFKNVVRNTGDSNTSDIAVESEVMGTLYYTSFSVLAEVLSRNAYLNTALESFDGEVDETAQSTINFAQSSFNSVLDALTGTPALEDENKGIIGKAWDKIKAFFKAIADWFAKQWGKFKGLFTKSKDQKKDTDAMIAAIKKESSDQKVTMEKNFTAVIDELKTEIEQLKEEHSSLHKLTGRMVGIELKGLRDADVAQNEAIQQLAKANEAILGENIKLKETLLKATETAKAKSTPVKGKDVVELPTYEQYLSAAHKTNQAEAALLSKYKQQSDKANKLAESKSPPSPIATETLSAVGKYIAAGLKRVPRLVDKHGKTFKGWVYVDKDNTIKSKMLPLQNDGVNDNVAWDKMVRDHPNSLLHKVYK